MKFLWTLLGFALAANLNAQMLEEDTKILDKVQGEARFELNAGEHIYTYDPEGGWFKVRKEIYVDPAMVEDEKYIAAEAEFTNKEGEAIGKSLDRIRVKEGEITKKYRGKERFRAIVEGYIFKTKIADDTRPEDIISKLLANKSRTQQDAGFKELFGQYNFEERSFGELIAYAYREVDKTLAEDKDFRVIVIFRGSGSPYAVITNDQTVTAPKLKGTWEDGSYKAIYFYKPTPAQTELIQDEILYTFVGL